MTTPLVPINKYLTADEVAAMLRVNRQTLCNWRLARKGPPATKLGRKVLYSEAALLAYLAANTGEGV